MHANTVFLLLLCMLASLTSMAYAAKKPSNAILLSEVQSLTFRKDKETTHRRVSAIPQMKAIGGSASHLFTPDTIRCRNAGSSYGSEDIEWTCTASLPPEFKLGSTDVICEGYDSTNDPYILKGSCGVEYRLLLTDRGEERYGRSQGWGFGGASAGGKSDTESLVQSVFWILFVAVAVFMVYKAVTNYREQAGHGGARRGAERGAGGWFGGGGDDGNDPPPPPYSPRPPPRKPAPEASTSWRPGFWSGAAAGAAAGYAAGGYGRNDRSRGYGGYGGGYGGYGGGGGGGGWFDRGEGPSTPRRSGGGGGSSSPGFSSSRYESTGFGGTSRR